MIENCGQVTIKWSDKATEEQRSEIRKEMARIRTRRAYGRTVEAARRLAQERGHAILSAPDSDEVLCRPHFVRIYYRSQGGEILYSESVHSERDAEKLFSEYAFPGLGTAKCGAQHWPVNLDETPPPFKGARLVLLPSQGPAGHVVSDEASDTCLDLPIAA